MSTTRPPEHRPAGLLAVLLALFFGSGAAALVYEVLWLKDLGRLFGATAHAAAINLAVFFLGLSAGGWVWGRRADRLANPLRTYAWLEIGIAVTAALYFLLFRIYGWIYTPLAGVVGDGALPALLIKGALALVILFPPAFLMGGTLPVMAQFLVRRAGQLGRWVTALYALNTVGAATGAFMAGFVLPRALGFRLSYVVAMSANVFIGLLALALAARLGAGSPDTLSDRSAAPRKARPSKPRATPPLPSGLVWLTAALSGFLTLGLEVLWTRMFSQVLQNSVYTFAAILTVFLLALALGSVLAHLLCRTTLRPERVLPLLLVAAGVATGLSPLLFDHLTSGMQVIGADLGWSGYVREVFLVVGTVIILPGLLAGAVFPYLMKLAESWNLGAGRTVGQLAALNTLAAIAGSVAAGFVLLELFGLWTGFRLLTLTYFVLAFVVVTGRGVVAGALRLVPAAGVVLFAVFLTYDDLSQVALDPERDETLVEVIEGAHGTVAVTRRDSGLGIKLNNTYVLGTSGSALNQRIQTWLPLALHPRPRSVFLLGMGTGISAGGALDFPLDRLVVSELNPDVIAASRRHFVPWLNGLFDDPRVRVVAEDGRNWLLVHAERFDVIVGDIFLTHKAGVGSLYTLEHFRTVLSRLEPGGLFVQWLPLFDLTGPQLDLIARTMLEVFPQVTLWRRGFSPRYPVYALVAHTQVAPLNTRRLTARLKALSERDSSTERLWLTNLPLAAYVRNYTPLRSELAGLPLSTDDRPLLEYLSPLTERESRVDGSESALAFGILAETTARWMDAQPPEDDPFLAGSTENDLDQVRAGLAYVRFETARRLGRGPEAEVYFSEYQRLVNGAVGPADGQSEPGPNAPD